MSGISPIMPQVAQVAQRCSVTQRPMAYGLEVRLPPCHNLFDAGVCLRYIQELLGHSSSKTAEIYTRQPKEFGAHTEFGGSLDTKRVRKVERIGAVWLYL